MQDYYPVNLVTRGKKCVSWLRLFGIRLNIHHKNWRRFFKNEIYLFEIHPTEYAIKLVFEERHDCLFQIL